MVVSLDVSP
jgi:hypothetical protein